MPILAKLKEFLESNGVRYEVRSHRPAFTAQEVAAAEHVPGREVAKVVMVLVDGKLAMAVLPAPSRVDLRRVAEALGVTPARLAEEGEFASAFPVFLLPLSIASARAQGLAGLSELDAGRGVRGALEQGALAAVQLLGRQDGFLANPQVRIPLPEAQERLRGLLEHKWPATIPGEEAA